MQLGREYIRECTQGKRSEPRGDWTKFYGGVGGGRGGGHAEIWRMRASGRKNETCKGPAAGMTLSSKE